MSENTFEENNSFGDYETNNFADSDLQTRLYAEIYYESNNQDELSITNTTRTIQFDSICNELNIVPESVNKPKDKQHFGSKGATGQLTHNNILHVQNSIDFHVSVEVQTSSDKSGQEANSMDVEYNSATNKSYSAIKENSVKKHKSSNIKKKHQKNLQEDNTVSLNNSVSEVRYSKYNVRQKSEKREMLSAKRDDKIQEISDDSDSEVSVFEVPIPPKPKPLLIDLQDSDEEKSVDQDNLHEKASKIINTRVTVTGINSKLEVKDQLSSQVVSLKNKNTSKSSYNKNTVNIGETTETTHAQEVGEDIVLNCSPVQKVASSISEIKQLSKNAEINPNQGDTLMENTKHKKITPQKKTKYGGSNDNLSQDTHMISPKRKLQTKKTQQNINTSDTECIAYDLHRQDFLENMLIPYRDQHKAVGAKRKCNSQINNKVKHKRQCTIQQSGQNVTPQDSNDKEKREGDKYFYDTTPSQELRDYHCNSTCSQENFDVGEIQRNMSKDPQMWVILDEDLMPRPSLRQQRNRFWNVRCSNCHQDGHQRYDCTVPRRIPICFMCGKKGHTESRCSLKICLTCGKQQNTFRKTCERCRVLYCTMCNSVGHKASKCPDLWRRYHQTTDMSNMPQDLDNTIKPPNLLYCCNCTKRGHESSTCKDYRWSQHFPTPATVTNYTTGPMYEPDAAISSECSRDMITSPFKAASSERLIPQNVVSMQQALGEHSGLSTNVNPSLLIEEDDKMPISQEVVDIPQTEEKANEITENQKTNQLIYITNEKIFTDIIYCCGKFSHKNNKNARIICQNLSMLAKSLPNYGKYTVTKLEKGKKILPTFLKTLYDKQIRFEVKIGFTTCQHKNVMLQLKALEQQLELLYELLLHWINLPIEEKDYGMDITLPKNCTKMSNILSNRMPQLRKMGFKSYNNCSDQLNPTQLFLKINSQKTLLEECRKTSKKEYYRQRTILGRLQIKLLMIFNTEPKPNKYVHVLENTMKELELKKHQSEELDIVTYLKFTLLYNILFVPHTPIGLHRMLYRFTKHAKRQKLSNIQQQELEEEINKEENHTLCTNINLPFSSIPSTSQDINFVENPSAIDIRQNVSNNITNEKESTNNTYQQILPINNATNNDRDKTMPYDPAVQVPPVITSFNTESVTILSEDLARNRSQSFTSDMNIDSIISTSEIVQNVQSTVPQKQTISKEERGKKLSVNIKSNKKKSSIEKKALELIKQAHQFQLPHMTKAAEDLRKKLNNEMLMPKHIGTLRKLIKLEKRYRKDMNFYCSSLNSLKT